jgi:hypothetical protein
VRNLIELVLQHPVVLLVVGVWLVGVVGKVLGGVGKQASQAAQAAREEARRRLQQRERSEPEKTEAKAEPPPRRRITQEEALSEMRRLLGTGPKHGSLTGTTSAEEERQHKMVVVPAEIPRRSSDKQRRLGQVDVHVDPHVGETLQQRRTPASGRVGQTDLGTLGGRSPAQAQAVMRAHRGLVDVHDLKRMLIMREVLGPPLALRPDWGPGQFS